MPKEILEEILNIATRAPSAMNTQPWEIAVVTGEVLDNIKRSAIEMLNSEATPEVQVPPKPFEGQYRQRQVELAIQLFQLMDIAGEDKEKRAWWMQKGYRFFDTPAAIYISVDKSLDEVYPQLDIGTCIEGQGMAFSETVVRKFAPIPESKHEPLENVTTWYGFD